MISVRNASLDDLESLVAIYNAAWRTGLADMFSVATFTADDFDDQRRTEATDLLLDDSVTTLVVDADGWTIGFSGVSLDDGVPCVDDLWIHPHSWGTGAAQALLAAIEDEHRSIGVNRLTTWIPGAAPRVRKFIEKMGWNPTGDSVPMGVYPEQPHLLVEYDRMLV